MGYLTVSVTVKSVINLFCCDSIVAIGLALLGSGNGGKHRSRVRMVPGCRPYGCVMLGWWGLAHGMMHQQHTCHALWSWEYTILAAITLLRVLACSDSRSFAVVLLLLSLPSAVLQVYSVESHRLALALQRQRKLAPLIREVILGELGLASGNVRLVNLL